MINTRTNVEHVQCDNANCRLVKNINNLIDLLEVLNNNRCENCGCELLDDDNLLLVNNMLKVYNRVLKMNDELIINDIYVGFSEDKIHATIEFKN